MAALHMMTAQPSVARRRAWAERKSGAILEASLMCISYGQTNGNRRQGTTDEIQALYWKKDGLEI